MAKKKKNTSNDDALDFKVPENYTPKKYSVVIGKYGPNISVEVEQVNEKMQAHSSRISLSIRGLTRHNQTGDIELFNLMHYAIQHAMSNRYPSEVEHVIEYADKFFFEMDIDAENGIACGDDISLELREMDFEAVMPSSDKTRRHMFDGRNKEYRYEFFGEKNTRTGSARRIF